MISPIAEKISGIAANKMPAPGIADRKKKQSETTKPVMPKAFDFRCTTAAGWFGTAPFGCSACAGLSCGCWAAFSTGVPQ